MADDQVAFVPGHVTGFFTVERTDDPTTTGSRGGGIALTDGVSVSVKPASETEIVLGAETIDMAAVDIVLDTLGISATVVGETDLPLGSGFGVSGAMALGTAMAANARFNLEVTKNELVTIAHGAEVKADSGLGDVVAQARGGMVLRLEAGSPQTNVLDEIPHRSRVEYLTLDRLNTTDVIGGDTEELSAAGTDAVSRVVEEPTVDRFMYASRRFAREADLLTADVRTVIEDVTEADGNASMAMLGETVFALGTGLSDAGYDPNVCRIDPTGATLVPRTDELIRLLRENSAT